MMNNIHHDIESDKQGKNFSRQLRWDTVHHQPALVQGKSSLPKIIVHHTLADSTTLAPGSETRIWYFWPGYDEKSYTQHGDKEGHP